MMRIYSVLILAIAVLFSSGAQSYAQSGNKKVQAAQIAATVNDRAILLSELEARVRMIQVSSGLPNKPEVIQRLVPQVMNVLIEEQLKLQEAERLGISVTPQEIEDGIGTIAEQNQLDPDQFRATLKQTGVPIGTLHQQIRSEIAWSKIIQSTLRSDVVVTDNDVDNVMDRMHRMDGQQEFLLSEIVLPIPKGVEESNVQGLAKRIVQEVRSKKAPFGRMAQQFSQAPGAPKGGRVGWIQAGQIAPELDAAMVVLDKGGVSEPIKSGGSYHILHIQDIRTISDDNLPPVQAVRNKLGTERLNRAQQRLLLNLKSSAFIENRT